MSEEFWHASCGFWRAMYDNTMRRLDVMEAERDEARAKLSEVAAQCMHAERERDEARRDLAEVQQTVRWLEGERRYLSPNAIVETSRRKDAECQLAEVAAQCVRAKERALFFGNWNGEVMAERDEARTIAGELARFAKQIQRAECRTAGNMPARLWHVGAWEAWQAIRPGVRKWLEGK